MRYSLKINIDRGTATTPTFDFSSSPLAEELTVQNALRIQDHISLSFAQYQRDQPGLVEQNWNKPYYDDDKCFVFLGGYVLSRNNQLEKYDAAPSPQMVADFLKENSIKEFYTTFKGNYYVVVFWKTEKRIEVISSPLTVHPAFYTYKNGELHICNYLGAFEEVHQSSISKRALVEFVLFDHNIDNKTLYNEVQCFMGGEITTFNQNGEEREIVYDLVKWYTPNPISRKKALPGLQKALQTSMGLFLQKTKKFNSALTGGFDGRLNLSFIPKDRYKDMQAISYGMKGSSNVAIPIKITYDFGIKHFPIHLNEDFENAYSVMGNKAIIYSGGHTGFHRANYPYAYKLISKYSRSCILGQCDMIRPLYTNPAGIVFNEPSRAIFFDSFDQFVEVSKQALNESLIETGEVDIALLKEIYQEIKDRYITAYPNLNSKLAYYFYLYKEGLVKFWQTEFHVVDLFVDDYVSFADLDYLELLFESEYAGIYKGLLADNQLSRRRGQDLYVDLMTVNNNKLNGYLVDRGYKPGWLKYGIIGWAFSGAQKVIKKKLKKKKDDTFNTELWTQNWIKSNKTILEESNNLFSATKIQQYCANIPQDKALHTFVRALSLKVWLSEREKA